MQNKYLEDIILDFLLDKCPEKAISSSIKELIEITLENSYKLESKVFEEVIVNQINWEQVKDTLELAVKTEIPE